MKAVILAGGFGTRLSEETDIRPKPMVNIGDRPILWHIMKMYSSHGINDFVICLGYKGYVIKEYFYNYSLHMSDVTFDMREQSTVVHQRAGEPWSVTLIDTGEKAMTGGRLKAVAPYIQDEDAFCLTYGDGVSDVDITRLVNFHKSHNALSTVTAIRPPGRFGVLNMSGNRIDSFEEKPAGDGAWINGGFFVLSPKVLEYIEGPNTVWEQEPMRRLAENGELMAYRHDGFWQCMDTLRDKQLLEKLWESGKAPWKAW